MANNTGLTEFILIGFPGLPPNFHHLVSVTMFLVYAVTLTANGTVIFLITLKENLHQPMYLIIANLALSDLLFDTITLPKTIAMYWFGASKISFTSCMFQLFCVHNLGSLDSLIIMLMAFDRYVAICKPLRYPSMITNRLVAFACGLLWLIAALFGMAIVILTSRLPYCQANNKINNCFCSSTAILSITCVDSFSTRRINFSLAMIVLLIPLTFIIFSYIVIIRTVSRSRNSDGWQKAFYTCSTHLFIIGMYYVPRLFVYTSYQLRLILNADVNILLLCLYTFVPHVASPIIYCLRTQEIKRTIGNIFKGNRLYKQGWF